MTFRTLNIAASLLFTTLAILLVAFPNMIYFLFSLDGEPVGDFLAKRAGALFLGLGTLLFLSRNASTSSARSAIALGIALTMGGLVIVGAYEFFRGFAGAGIWLAMITEAVFAFGYLKVFRSDQLQGKA